MGSKVVDVSYTSDIAPPTGKDFFDIQSNSTV